MYLFILKISIGLCHRCKTSSLKMVEFSPFIFALPLVVTLDLKHPFCIQFHLLVASISLSNNAKNVVIFAHVLVYFELSIANFKQKVPRFKLDMLKE